MLDFTPQGLDRMGTVSAYLLGTSVILLAILIAVGFVYFGMGRKEGRSRAQERGVRMAGIGLMGVMVLTSLGSAITFGLSQGTASLMPEGAQQQDVVVEREAATSTCTQAVTREFDTESNPPSPEEQWQILDELTGGRSHDHSHLEGTELQALRWYPVGPQCDSDNHTSAEGTDIEIQLVHSIETFDEDNPSRSFQAIEIDE